MKLIEACIPPEALYEIQDLLAAQGIQDVVASEVAVEVLGDCQDRDSNVTRFVPEIKLEMAIADEQAHTIAQRIFEVVAKRRGKRPIQVLIARLEQVVETGEGRLAALLGAHDLR